VCWRGSRIDVIHEEKDFECDTGMDGKPEQLFQCSCDVTSSSVWNRGGKPVQLFQCSCDVTSSSVWNRGVEDKGL